MFKAGFKLALLGLWLAVCCGLAWTAKAFKKMAFRDRMVCVCYRGILRIAGIRLHVTGGVGSQRPLMVVSNHLSYLDIALVGSQWPVRFMPKSEINNWPVIGWICRLCDAIYVDRKPDKIQEASRLVRSALAKGNVVLLFPEGTTGNGINLLPFRPGFFNLAEEPVDGYELAVQPIAITYTHIRNLPIDSTQWPSIAWYGNMELAPHAWELLKLAPIDAEIIFLPPTTLSKHGDRKQLAGFCQKVIAEAIDGRKQEK